MSYPELLLWIAGYLVAGNVCAALAVRLRLSDRNDLGSATLWVTTWPIWLAVFTFTALYNLIAGEPK